MTAAEQKLLQSEAYLHLMRQIHDCQPARPCEPDNRVLVAALKAEERQMEWELSQFRAQCADLERKLDTLRHTIRQYDESQPNLRGAL